MTFKEYHISKEILWSSRVILNKEYSSFKTLNKGVCVAISYSVSAICSSFMLLASLCCTVSFAEIIRKEHTVLILLNAQERFILQTRPVTETG